MPTRALASMPSRTSAALSTSCSVCTPRRGSSRAISCPSARAASRPMAAPTIPTRPSTSSTTRACPALVPWIGLPGPSLETVCSCRVAEQ
uniref:Uncharacterized protein n=1 Tax=Phytophthora fragariae TaxID=53985 RepID=A0A6A3ER68_9STRA|nr:hypothetical protein PF009_g17446 [Phytophthora fragariae]